MEVAVLGRSSGCWDGSTTVAPRLLLQPMTGTEHSVCSDDVGGSRGSLGVEDVRRNLVVPGDQEHVSRILVVPVDQEHVSRNLVVVLEDLQVLKTSVAACDPPLVGGAFTLYGNRRTS